MSDTVWGIDLGTTYSCIARVNQAGKPEVIPNADGAVTTPSVVLFSGPESFQVGMEAKNQLQAPGASVCHLVKRHMGDTAAEWSHRAHGGTWIAPEVSAIILRALAEDAERATGVKVENVVITVPAWFGDKQRDATRTAGGIAGLNVLNLINEPTAAAIAYGFGQDVESAQTVLVYDLGGGTFDATGMRIEENKIRVLATLGDHRLGGADWDERLTTELARKFAEANPNAGNPLDDPVGSIDLLVKAEDLKRSLTAKDSITQLLFAGTERANVTFTREEFESATEDLLERTIQTTRDVLGEMERDHGAVPDRILLVGGSSLMPMVARRLEAEFGLPTQLENPNLAVAHGAALYGQIEELKRIVPMDDDTPGAVEAREDAIREVARERGMMPEVVKRMTEMEIVNVCSRGFGIEVLTPGGDADNPEDYFVDHLVKRNTPLPADVPRIYHPIEDGQAGIHLVLREQAGQELSKRVDDNDVVKDGRLPLPAGARTTDDLDVRFEMTTDGQITVTMRHPEVPEPLVLQVRTAAVMSAEEQERATRRVGELVRAS